MDPAYLIHVLCISIFYVNMYLLYLFTSKKIYILYMYYETSIILKFSKHFISRGIGSNSASFMFLYVLFKYFSILSVDEYLKNNKDMLFLFKH